MTPITDAEVAAACKAAYCHVTANSMADMRAATMIQVFSDQLKATQTPLQPLAESRGSDEVKS